MSEDKETIEILKQFSWNWDVAADHLGREPNELKEMYGQYQTYVPHVLSTQSPFDSSHISRQSVKKSQEFVKEHFEETLPLLFKQNISEEEKSKIAQTILLELGLTYKLTNSDTFMNAYKQLEEEALTLERWREQGDYLTVVEDALMRILSNLTNQAEEE